MSTQHAERRQRRMKTWSSLQDLGRAPTEYEIVTHNMVHTKRDRPLEMGPESFGNQWLLKYRDSSSLKVSDWEQFRDPDGIFYRRYNIIQDDAETYIDKLLEEYTEQQDSDAGLSEQCVQLLKELYTPSRYLVHGLQMMSGYLQQMSSTSYVANAASFQTADQLRRVQRLSYRTRQLANAHGDAGFAVDEKEAWTKLAGWQGLRRALEQLLVTFHFDEVFVATNLLVKPVADHLTLVQTAKLMIMHGDQLDALICKNLWQDALRSQNWSCALSQFLIDQDAGNKAILQQLVSKWRPNAESAVNAYCQLLGSYSTNGVDAEVLAKETQDYITVLLERSGLI